MKSLPRVPLCKSFTKFRSVRTMAEPGSTATAGPTATVKLQDGVSVPAVGYGTGTKWFVKRDGVPRNAEANPIAQGTVEAVRKALAAGYTHIDAAEMYGTEREVGIALAQHMKEHNVSREQLFITTKVYESLNDVDKALTASLERLGLSYVDLYLIHAPFKFQPGLELEKTWRDLESAVEQGRVKSIGVSNFEVSDLKQLLSIAKIKPTVNQVEGHPYLQQPELLEYCKQNGILLEVYSPLVSLTRHTGGPVDEVVEVVAQETHTSPGQVLLAWARARGTLPLLTTANDQRLTDYLSVFASSNPAVTLSQDQDYAAREVAAAAQT